MKKFNLEDSQELNIALLLLQKNEYFFIKDLERYFLFILVLIDIMS